ncbi:TIGR01244 family sulfur transferase [Brackiella oedipodis]|uniref:TIGR01244 family sulfur transferase n=1 Tax=Brackiella oedipodis TaxID=124225 RepID=UPI0005705ED6|nr:TIGR01244 family sulfur transferase [Brackiella oedipodis]
MLPIQALNDHFAVAGLLNEQDMAAVKQAGFKSVIINIPDQEAGPQQALAADVIQAAQQQGLEAVYQPVAPGQLTPEHIHEFAEYLQSLPSPVLAYCRSGIRCSVLYNAAMQLSNQEE